MEPGLALHVLHGRPAETWGHSAERTLPQPPRCGPPGLLFILIKRVFAKWPLPGSLVTGAACSRLVVPGSVSGFRAPGVHHRPGPGAVPSRGQVRSDTGTAGVQGETPIRSPQQLAWQSLAQSRTVVGHREGSALHVAMLTLALLWVRGHLAPSGLWWGRHWPEWGAGRGRPGSRPNPAAVSSAVHFRLDKGHHPDMVSSSLTSLTAAHRPAGPSRYHGPRASSEGLAGPAWARRGLRGHVALPFLPDHSCSSSGTQEMINGYGTR